MPTLKQRVGTWLMPQLPVNPWVFMTLRVELRAMRTRLLNRILPWRIARRRALVERRDVLVNVGCGPFGRDGWVNLDLADAPCVTMRVDARWGLPLADGAARGIHVEHYFEHLQPGTERPRFLAECRRCLAPGGILRIIVPDLRKYIDGYLAPGWDLLNQVGCGEVVPPQRMFGTKIEVLNHVFVQAGEHYGGFDAEYLRVTLAEAGFEDIEQVGWRTGRFPGGPIDREQHASYSLFMEARR
jgi:predicted SAM-dependent methyltransferase